MKTLPHVLLYGLLALGLSATALRAEEELPVLSLDAIEGRPSEEAAARAELGGEAVAQAAVNDLDDVPPEHWAYRAVQNLSAHHPILKGEADGRFGGSRPLSRYEFALGLRAFLQQVDELVAESKSERVSREEFNTLEQLRLSFATELSVLKGRVRSLENQAKRLEGEQFSITAKLAGNIVMAVNGGNAGGTIFAAGAANGSTGGARLLLGAFSVADAQAAQHNPNIVAASSDGSIGVIGGLTHQENNIPGNVNNVTFIARTRLNLLTSFTGDDLLQVRLGGVAGTDPAFATYYFGGLSYGGDAGDFKGPMLLDFDKIQYSSTAFGPNFRYYVGPALDPRDIVDRNSFAGNDLTDFSSTFFTRNRLLLGVVGNTPGQNPILETSPGFGFDWQISPAVALRAVYNAGEGGLARSFGRGGVTGDLNQIVGELEIQPAPNLAVRLQYSRYTVPLFFVGIDPANAVIQPEDVPLVGNAATSVFAFNAEWAASPGLGLFARYATANTNLGDNGLLGGSGTAASSMWQLGAVFAGLGGPKNALGLAVGQPTHVFSATGSIDPSRALGSTSPAAGTATPLTADSGSETDVELFWRLAIDERLSVTPDLQFIFAPHSVAVNPLFINAALRAVFTF